MQNGDHFFSQSNCALEAASECCLLCSWIQKLGREFPILFLLCAKNWPEYLTHSVTLGRDKNERNPWSHRNQEQKLFCILNPYLAVSGNGKSPLAMEGYF